MVSGERPRTNMDDLTARRMQTEVQYDAMRLMRTAGTVDAAAQALGLLATRNRRDLHYYNGPATLLSEALDGLDEKIDALGEDVERLWLAVMDVVSCLGLDLPPRLSEIAGSLRQRLEGQEDERLPPARP